MNPILDNIADGMKGKGLTRLDALLLRWGLLSVLVLLCTMVLLLTGAFEWVDMAQLTLLCGSPFYMEAEATQHAALSPAGVFAVCVGVTLYLALVLLRHDSFVQRVQVLVPALLAVAMPGLLCVLWDCVFYVAPLVFCVLLTWLLVVSIPFFSRIRS
ncbi:MAG: hypothetical protein Q4F38_04585 [Akkermansia sp.]|nr:hypothetical protein [Akkermansia sp.]